MLLSRTQVVVYFAGMSVPNPPEPEKSESQGTALPVPRSGAQTRKRKLRRRIAWAVVLVVLLPPLLWGIGWLGLFLYTLDGYYLPKYAPLDINLPVIRFGEDQVYLRDYGSRDEKVLPIILGIHDGPGLDMHGIRNLRQLHGAFRVVLYDQRGCGLSSRRASATYSLTDYLVELDSIYQRYHKIAPVGIVAQGWGAQLVAAWLEMYPERTPAGVLWLAPQPLSPEVWPEVPAFDYKTAGRWKALEISFQEKHLHYRGDTFAPADWLATAHWRELPPGFVCAPDSQRAGVIPVWRAGAHAQQSLRRQLWSENDSLLRPFATTLQNRTAPQIEVWVGQCDKRTGVAFQERQRHLLPAGSPLAELPGCGRYPLSEAPDTTLSVIRLAANRWFFQKNK